MKASIVLCSLLLVAVSHADTIDPNCDRILNSMADGCKSIRSGLISPASMDPKVVCCAQMRYNICVQSVNGYATIAKATRICPAQNYDSTMVDLNSNIAMMAVKTLCEKFDSQTCITDPVNNAWTSVKNTVQSNTNLDVDKLGEQIGKNWNDAMSSLGNFASGLQDTIAKQNIPGRLREGASALSTSIQGRTKELSDMVSGQGINRYSVVGDDKQDSLSLDSIVHSVIPEVEIVEKKPDAAIVPKLENAVTPISSKRWNVMDWFNSLSFNSNPTPQVDTTKPANNPIQQRGNPYSLV